MLGSFGSTPGTPTAPRPGSQSRQEQAGAFPKDAVSWPSSGFPDCANNSDTGETAVPRSLPLTFQNGGLSYMEAVSLPPGAHGISSTGCSISPFTHLPSAEVTLGPWAEPQESSAVHCARHQTVTVSPSLVGEQGKYLQGEYTGTNDTSASGNDRCFIDRLGSSVQREQCQRVLAQLLCSTAHQHPGAEGSPPCPPPFPTISFQTFRANTCW